MFMANTNKIKYTSGNTISNGAITNNNASLGVDTAVDYGPTSITGFWQGVTPNNGGYTIYKVSETEQPRIVVAQDDEALIFFANSFGASNVTTVTDALLYFKDNTGYFVTNRKVDSITTSGMTMMYDPGLVQSYVKSGTTMNNLGTLGAGVNTPLMTLTSGTTYNSDKGGSLLYSNSGYTYGRAATTDFVNDFTYNVWFKATSFEGINTLISRGNGLSKLHLENLGDANLSRVSFYDNYTSLNMYTSGATIELNKWVNIVVKHIEGTKTQVFVDNVMILEDTTTFNLYNENISDFFIGGELSSPTHSFSGYIGHVALYNRSLSDAEIEKNYNALRNRYYGSATGQTGFFMSAISGGTTYAYVILDPATGTVSSPIDTGIPFADYSLGDVKPLNHSGYGLYFYGQNNGDDKIVQFIDAFGTLIETYSGNTNNYNTDVHEGKMLFAHFHDLGVLIYFDGISVGTYTYDTNTESVDVEWEDDGTSRDGSFIIRSMSGSTYTHKILNASRAGAVSLPSYDNSVYSVNVRVYDSGDYVVIDRYDPNNSIYTSFEMYDLLGNIISVNDISSFNYDSRSSYHFGTNKYSIIFRNDNDQNQDYKIFAYNGTSVISTTHERGTNFANFSRYSQNYDDPTQDYLIETLTYRFLTENNTSNNGPFTTIDYMNLLSICNGTTGFTVNSIATGTTISYGVDGNGNVYSDFIIKPDGKLYAMLVLPSGVTYTELVADPSTITGESKYEAGNYHIFRTETDNTHPTFYLVNGTTGALLDTLSFESFDGYSWSVDQSYTAFAITDSQNNIGWYLNTSTNEFTQFSGSYQNIWTPPSFFRGNDVFTDHPSLVMFNYNMNANSARILSTTGLSNEFNLPAISNNNFTLYRGNSFISYYWRSVNNDQPYVRLIDFSGNTLNEYTDVDDSGWNFWASDHNNDVVIVVSGQGLENGTLRVNIINTDGTTDQQVMSQSDIQNYWTILNDWHWWD